MGRRWRLIHLLVATLATVGAVAAQSGSEALVIATPDLGPTLDPQMTVVRNAQPVYSAIFDPLTTVNNAGELQPALALSWSTVSDTTWEFKLREGVAFQNGEPFNADSVKYSIERVIAPETASPLAGRIGVVTGVDVVDDFTVHVHTSSPYPLLPRALSVIYIVPPTYLAEVGPEQFAAEPIGTGPYTLVESRRNVSTVLESWDGSWRGVPPISRVVFQIVPEASVRASALRTGEVDIAVAIVTDLVPELEASGIEIATGNAATVMQMPLVGHRDTPLQDRRVRQALNYAIDREAILEFVVQGYGTLSPGQLVLPGVGGYTPEVTAYPYDPEMARELLAEAGYSDGFEMTIIAAQGRYPNDQQIIETVQSYFAEVGVDLEWERMEAAQVSQTLYAGAIENTLLTVLGYAGVMDIDFPANYYTTTHAFQLHSNVKRYDELFFEAQQELDPDIRQELLTEMAKVFKDEAMGIMLFQPLDVYAYGPRVNGFEPRTDVMIRLDQISLNN